MATVLNPIELSVLGFLMSDGLPSKEYAVCDGAVTVVLDQSGGINMIEYQGPRRTDGPRRGAFFSNGIWRRESFFNEPVLEFVVGLNGHDVPIRFRDLVLTPFAVTCRFTVNETQFEYALWIRGNTVMLEYQATDPATVTR